MDFSDISDKTPTQELTIPQGREVGEYALKYVPYSHSESLFLSLI